MRAGANLIQVYTSFVYEGSALPVRLARAAANYELLIASSPPGIRRSAPPPTASSVRSPWNFDLQDSDADRELTIPLKGGMERKIVVVDSDDVPIGNAVVAETATGRFLGARTTDFSGKLAFQLGEREERTLFIVPPNGSFAVARLRGSGEREAVVQRVVVPSPLATLDVTTRTRAGTVVASIWFLVRYNGQLVPMEVMQILDQVQGMKFFTGATGSRRLSNMPLGTYELWPAAAPMRKTS